MKILKQLLNNAALLLITLTLASSAHAKVHGRMSNPETKKRDYCIQIETEDLSVRSKRCRPLRVADGMLADNDTYFLLDTDALYIRQDGTAPPTADQPWAGFDIDNAGDVSLNSISAANGSIVINESGADKDTRIEGVGEVNALFIKGSNGFVGIGSNAPEGILHVGSNSINPNFLSGTDDTILSGGLFARTYILGSANAAFGLIDSGAAADAKLFEFFNNNGLVNLASLNDNGFFRHQNIITMELLTGDVGIGTAGAVSILDVNGAIGLAIVTVTGDTTLDATHSTVVVDTNGEDITITLPTTASAYNSTDGIGRIYNVVSHYDNTSDVIVDGDGAETINGGENFPLEAAEEILTVQSTGTEWIVK